MDKQQTLAHASRIAQQAGALLRIKLEQPIVQMTKASDIDIVTEADQETEAFISQQLLQLYPEHHLIGEEGGGQGASIDTADYHWYIDPIDGTTNFANGIPHFCVSMALTDKQRNPIIVVIYDPTRDDIYTAIAGQGAHLNGKLIQVTSTAKLVNAVVGSGFGYDKHTNPDDNLPQWGAFTKQVRGVRRMGSAALDLAYVAAGRLDAYWEKALNPWDALAGMLLVIEAGGTVTDYQGGNQPQHDAQGRYLATNGHLHEAMLAVFAETYAW